MDNVGKSWIISDNDGQCRKKLENIRQDGVLKLICAQNIKKGKNKCKRINGHIFGHRFPRIKKY